MTPQDIFDKVATHLLTQNRKATNGEVCRYRLRNLKCAVGCLIPDHLYRIEMEGDSVAALFSDFPEIANHLGSDNLDLLEALQAVHDVTPVEQWRDALADLAADRFNLNTKVLDQ